VRHPGHNDHQGQGYHPKRRVPDWLSGKSEGTREQSRIEPSKDVDDGQDDEQHADSLKDVK
jgi:hypothetical protein